jgi:hypothetical protein
MVDGTGRAGCCRRRRAWDRANSLVGNDHTELLGPRDAGHVGDQMTVRDWTYLANAAGFHAVEVLWRDADGVIVAAVKDEDPRTGRQGQHGSSTTSGNDGNQPGTTGIAPGRPSPMTGLETRPCGRGATADPGR